MWSYNWKGDVVVIKMLDREQETSGSNVALDGYMVCTTDPKIEKKGGSNGKGDEEGAKGLWSRRSR